jgi:formyl-CoA transferase
VNAFKEFDWANDRQWDDVLERFNRIVELQEHIHASLKTLTTEDVLHRLRENDLPGAYVAEMTDVHNDPQVINNSTFVEFDGGALGKLRQARLAPRFEGTPTSPPTMPPALGEDTQAVLREVGYSAEAIGEMQGAGVLGKAGLT